MYRRHIIGCARRIGDVGHPHEQVRIVRHPCTVRNPANETPKPVSIFGRRCTLMHHVRPIVSGHAEDSAGIKIDGVFHRGVLRSAKN